MEEIEVLCQQKGLDEKATECLKRAVQEFEELFGKYIPKEEVIRRINNNLNSIVFASLDKKEWRGTYNRLSKEIKIKPDLTGEELANVFFHEMVHCIRIDEDREYVGRGIEEGFTQYVTRIRGLKYKGKEDGSYPILSEQIKNLADLIGEEKFLEIGFMKQNSMSEHLEELFYEYGIDFESFQAAFDTIWKCEKDIIPQNAENRGYKNYLEDVGLNQNPEKYKMERAKTEILDTFITILENKQINTPEEFGKLFDKLQSYTEQLDTTLDKFQISMLIGKYKELLENGYSENEILGQLNSEEQAIIKMEYKIEEFLQKTSSSEKLGMLTYDGELDRLMGEFSDVGLVDRYKERIISELYGQCDEFFDYRNLYYDFAKRGLAAFIIDKGYNLDNLEIEKIDIVDEKIIYKLINVVAGKKETFTNVVYDYDSGELQEKENIDEYRAEDVSIEIIPSKNELLRQMLEAQLEVCKKRIDDMKKVNAPQFLMARDERRLTEIQMQIDSIYESYGYGLETQEVEKRAIKNTTTTQRIEAREDESTRMNLMEQDNDDKDKE